MTSFKQLKSKLQHFFFTKKNVVINGVRYNDTSWIKKPVTGDQLRIEKYLMQQSLKGKNIFHVGIGSSSIAKKTSRIAHKVYGITVVKDEKKLADELKLENYDVELMDKYSSEILNIPYQFDFIIDNNPSSFTDKYESFTMLISNYIQLLKAGGIFVTDKEGMQYYESYSFPVSIDDFELFRSKSINIIHLTDSLIGIQKKQN